MTTASDRAVFALVLLAAALVAYAFAGSAEGQGSTSRVVEAGSPRTPAKKGAAAAAPRPASTITVTTLARACVAEASWGTADQAAVLHVLARRAKARRVPIERMAVQYISGFRVRPTARLSWVMRLEPACEEPPGWPVTSYWPRHRGKCLATFDRVRAFLQGKLPDPCPGSFHWGARYGADLRRAARAIVRGRWVVVVCRSETANAFYAEVRP